jgi:hypothetical protein
MNNASSINCAKTMAGAASEVANGCRKGTF